MTPPFVKDVGGAGPRFRLWDQMAHEHVRSMELDLHDVSDTPSEWPFSSAFRHPGEYAIYHTEEPLNSSCWRLSDCLELLQRLDYVAPQHEIVHVALELKEVDFAPAGFPLDRGVFDKPGYGPGQLDRLLWEHLGSRLYTPAEFMSRCPQAKTLRECAAAVGWPTIDQLRGRYIFTVHGTTLPYVNIFLGGAANERSWWQYASADIRTRAAFPMSLVTDCTTDVDLPYQRADYYNNCGNQDFIDTYRRALDNTIFFDLEEPTNPDFDEAELLLRDPNKPRRCANPTTPEAQCGHPVTPPAQTQFPAAVNGIVFSKAAFLVDHDPPAGADQNAVGEITQFSAVEHGAHIVMTDYPVNFIGDVIECDPLRGTCIEDSMTALPTRSSRVFYQRLDVDLGSTQSCQFTIDQLTEPASRFYFDTENRFIGHDVIPHANLTLTRQDDLTKAGFARAIRVAPPIEQESVEDWEVFPATSMIGHGSGPLALTPFGRGCFEASSAPAGGGDFVRVCRKVNADEGRSVDVTIETNANGATTSTSTRVSHNLIQGQRAGDALRVRLQRTDVPPAATTATVYTADELNPNGTMNWSVQRVFVFQRDLMHQGLFQEGDGVFTGTRLNGRFVSFSEFTPAFTSPHVVDESFCVDGSCRGPQLPSHENVVNVGGVDFVGVHETAGPTWNGQWRTLYTTDQFEVTTSGLGQFHVLNKFFLPRDRAASSDFLPLYRCVNWSTDVHEYWLDTHHDCPNSGGAGGRPQAVIGYVARRQRPGTVPLYHMRKVTHPSITLGADAFDHYFARDLLERAAKVEKEYSDVSRDARPIGYVYPEPFDGTRSTITDPMAQAEQTPDH